MSIIKFIYRFFKSILVFYQRIVLKFQFKVNKVVHTDLPIISGYIFLRNHGSLSLGSNLRFNSSLNSTPIGGDTKIKIVVSPQAKLTIGNNTGISGSTIYCTKEINIGTHVFIGGSCKIYDTDFHAIDPYVRTGGNDNQINRAAVNIGNYVFIGGSSIILKGVTIGDKSIVGAGSVVTKNIPEKEIWGGNPAKFIRKI